MNASLGSDFLRSAYKKMFSNAENIKIISQKIKKQYLTFRQILRSAK